MSKKSFALSAVAAVLSLGVCVFLTGCGSTTGGGDKMGMSDTKMMSDDKMTGGPMAMDKMPMDKMAGK